MVRVRVGSLEKALLKERKMSNKHLFLQHRVVNCFSTMARLHKIKLLLRSQLIENLIYTRKISMEDFTEVLSVGGEKDEFSFGDGSESFDAISGSDSSIIESNESSYS